LRFATAFFFGVAFRFVADFFFLAAISVSWVEGGAR
jgi:hypothetical protein